MSTPGIELDRLLENARWVRALGVELVGAAEAEDLAQEAWVVALEQRGGVRNPAAWLSGVVRRLAGRARRGAERRARRERAAARPEAQPAAGELVAEAELSRALIRAVTELDEPFRSTVLLRFYRGWTPEEIARSQGVPGATVRTRLHRALAKLRERFDREHGGRQAWALAFASPGALPATTVEGGVLLGTKAMVGTAAVLAAAAGTAWWWGREGGGDSARIERRVAAGGEPPAERQAPPEGAAGGGGPQREAATAGVVATAGEVLLYGRVTDPEGRPVALEWLGLEDEHGLRRSAADRAAGSYSLAGLASGRYHLLARAPGFVSLREELVLGPGEPHRRHDLVLAPGLAIPVRIVDESGALWQDDADDRHEGALDVVVTPGEPGEGLCGLRLAPGQVYGAGEYLRAGDEGSSAVPRGASGLVRAAIAPPFFVSLILRDATLATRRVDGPLPELFFTLRREAVEALRGGVRVRFVDAISGRAVGGGQAILDPPSTFSGGGVPLDGDGSVRLAPFAPGLHRLRFFHPDYADTSRGVRVPIGRIEELGDVLVWPKATIRGTVRDARGRPVAASVRIAPLADLRGPADLQGGFTRVVGGRLELEGAARGPVRLLVQVRDHAPLARTIDATSGLAEGLVLQAEEGVRVVLRTPEAWIGRQVTLADEAGVPLETWTVTGGALATRLARGRYELWIGRAERVDARQGLVVEETPLELDLGGGG